MKEKDMEFEALVNAYADDLYRYAYWLCKESTLAEDMVQDTFIRAWKALHNLQNEKAAKAWLFTILRREVARHYSRKRIDIVPIEEMDLERIGFEGQFDQANKLLVQQALGNLDMEYREPLVLQVLGGYSCEEIADLLDIKPGAVMTRVFRARQKLRLALSDQDQSAKVIQL